MYINDNSLEKLLKHSKEIIKKNTIKNSMNLEIDECIHINSCFLLERLARIFV